MWSKLSGRIFPLQQEKHSESVSKSANAETGDQNQPQLCCMRANIFKEASPSHVETKGEHRQRSRPGGNRDRVPVAHPGIIIGKVACAICLRSLREGYSREVPCAAGKVWI